MKKLTEIKKQGQQYWSGFKFLWSNPYQISHSLNVNSSKFPRIASTIISRVRRPESWLFRVSIEEVCANKCHIQVDTLGAMSRLSSLAYAMEEAVEVYLKNLIPYYFDYSVRALEMDVDKGFRFPVDCVFSMDSEDVKKVLSQLKLGKKCRQDFSFEFQSQHNFCGRASVAVEIFQPKALPSAKGI